LSGRRVPDATDRGYLANLETRWDPQRSAGAHRPRRSDTGNGEAVAGAARIGGV